MKAIGISGMVLLVILSEGATAHPAAPWIVVVLTLLFLFFIAKYIWERVRGRASAPRP